MQSVLLLVSLCFFLLSFLAQYKVKSTIQSNHNRLGSIRMSGAQVAQLILSSNGISNVPVKSTPGLLTDNYNPLSREVSLSSDIYQNQSISAIAVAAHEVGHAIQHDKKYPFLVLRTALYPVMSFTSKAFPILLVASLLFQLSGLFQVAVMFYAVSVFFAIITLPVEFDASKRAMQQLKSLNLVSSDEMPYVKKVLRAAAMTYVVAALISIVELLRFLMYFRSE